MSLFARARYGSEALQIDAYTMLVEAKSRLLTAITEQQDLYKTYAVNSETLQNINTIREIARTRIDAELGSVRSELAAQQRNERVEEARAKAEVERYELDAARSRKAQEDLGRPAEPAPAEPTMADKIKEVADEIDELCAFMKELRDKAAATHGGEENIPEDERERLEETEFAVKRAMQDIYAKHGI